MTDGTSKGPPPPPERPEPEDADQRPAMRADERLIGRSIIGSGAPRKR